MKNHTLYITVRVDVVTSLKTLPETIREFEQNTDYGFSSTENVQVVEIELLQTEISHP